MEITLENFEINVLPSRKRLVEFTLLQLLQHNVQLGAVTKFSLLSSRWFTCGVRQKFTIINLFKTVLSYRVFLDVVKLSAMGRRRLLFVNERRYTSSVVGDVAVSIGEAYVMGRWVGGSLTNFKRLWFMYERMLAFRAETSLSRFELNLKRSLRGLFLLKSFPGLSFFNSVKHSYWGAGEAYAMFVPSGGIVDTDAYPHSIMFPIPGNDDAFGSIFFLNRLVARVVILAKITAMVARYSKACEETNKWVRKLPFLRRRWKQQSKRRFGEKLGSRVIRSTN